MERYIVPVGSKIPIETVFNEVQNLQERNIWKRFTSLFNLFGAFKNTIQLLDYGTEYVKIKLNPGIFIFPSGEVCEIKEPFIYTAEYSIADSGPADTGIYFFLIYTPQDAEPIKILNNYTYQESDITRFTKRLDNYQIRHTLGNSTVQHLNEIIVARFDIYSNTLDTNSYIAKIKSELINPNHYLQINSEPGKKIFQDNTILQFKNSENTLTEWQFNNQIVKIGNNVFAHIRDKYLKIVYDDVDLTINNNSINLSDKFIIDKDGNVTINGSLNIKSGILKFNNIRILEDADVNNPPIAPITVMVRSEYFSGLKYLDPSVANLIPLARKKSNSTNTVQLNIHWDIYIEGKTINGTNYIEVTNLIPSNITLSALNNYYIYLSAPFNQTYRIISIDNNKVYVKNLDGTLPSFTEKSFTGTEKILVHCNADSYEVIVIPYDGNRLSNGDKIEKIVSYKENYVIPECKITTNIGTSYAIKVRSIKGNQKSIYKDITKYTVRPQEIINNGSLNLTASASGFRVGIMGWETAEEFEICYTTDITGPDFNNPNHLKIITTQRVVDINTPYSAEFKIAVRPLICGFVVSNPKLGTVVSGNGSIPPNTTVIASQYVNLKTYSGSVSSIVEVQNDFSNIDTEHYYKLIISNGTLKSPALSPISKNSLNVNELIGDILTLHASNFQSLDCLIIADDGDPYSLGMIIKPLDPQRSIIDTSKSYTFTINTSERGRLIIKQSDLPVDYKIIKIDVDCDVVVGGAARMRIYQETKKEYADHSVSIVQSDHAFSSPCDVNILYSYGKRTLCVDLYDTEEVIQPDGPKPNTSCFSGRITIYAIPLYELGATKEYKNITLD